MQGDNLEVIILNADGIRRDLSHSWLLLLFQNWDFRMSRTHIDDGRQRLFSSVFSLSATIFWTFHNSSLNWIFCGSAAVYDYLPEVCLLEEVSTFILDIRNLWVTLYCVCKFLFERRGGKIIKIPPNPMSKTCVCL